MVQAFNEFNLDSLRSSRGEYVQEGETKRERIFKHPNGSRDPGTLPVVHRVGQEK